jgi:hypothetical protein
MKKLMIASAVAMLAGVGSANAALAPDAVLAFDNAVMGCVVGGTYPACDYGLSTVVGGSYFGMDTNGNQVIEAGERNALQTAGTGVTLGTAQPNIGDIDLTWMFGGNPGNHVTTQGLSVTSAAGNSATIGMTGWTVMWGSPQAPIDMGQGADATVTCAVDCAVGDSFVLDYSAIVPDGGFKGFYYTLHLEGTVASSEIPVPAAVWLLGSGLLGLVGVARRRKTQA